jgi:uncharacterized protein
MEENLYSRNGITMISEADIMSRHLMLIPSLGCQAKCSYCFGPNHGPVMQQEAFDAAVNWIAATGTPGETLELTFHGGEPLLVGKEWYRQALPGLRQRFDGRLKLGIQSNLWLLDDEFCALFREHGVSIGTSLDGPETINDSQRGKGYFERTLAGINTARRHGMNPAVICTFTRHSASHYREVFDFFAEQELSFSVHEAVCSLGDDPGVTALFPDEAAGTLVDLFDYYLENITRTQVSTFDAMARGLSAQNGALCTFGNCLGKYLTITPGGGIYSCNRFAHHPQWQLGTAFDPPDLAVLTESEAWQKLRQRELTVHEDCGDCRHFEYCKGGCPYNALSSAPDRRDPHCTIYRRLFDVITRRALDEVFSDENIGAVLKHGPGKYGLLRKGRLIQVMKDGLHPQELARKARETLAAAALAGSITPEQAVEKLERAGIVTRRNIALESLRSLRQRLDQSSQQGLANVYIHVTNACNLSCAHCYARSGPGKSPVMEVAEMTRLAQAAVRAGFSKVVITGGEPLAHPRRNDLLDALARLRLETRQAQIVLRTNLAYPLTPELKKKLAHSSDQVVVSIDGDEACHDARRGSGTYARTLENLRLLLASNPTAEISVSATLTAEQSRGGPGEAVRCLGENLGVEVRIKSILPVGRGLELGLTPAYYNSLDENTEALSASAGITTTCGLGMNLYIGPRGECYPCYALLGSKHRLGNALEEGLAAVLKRNDPYRLFTVDSNSQCQACGLRYLCGGFCRAWSSNGNPNSGPRDCTALQLRAYDSLLGALETLDVPLERWQAAGLPDLKYSP